MPDIPVEFLLFAVTLVGVALTHHRALEIATTGLIAITVFKVFFSGFPEGPGVAGFAGHLHEEWVVLTNLAGLLLGFALLSRHFEQSRVPKVLPRLLPTDWKGAFVMLVMVFVLSSFLDNIAATLIGGAMAHSLFPSVHIGYIAGIVAAANAGGAGSVLGDTTTTMMWIDGIRPGQVFHAYVGAVVVLFVSSIPASLQQHRHAPMVHAAMDDVRVDWPRLAIVGAILTTAVGVNVIVNTQFSAYSDTFPFLGATVWATLLLTAAVRQPDWSILRESLRGTAFLLSLVLAASMMPVERLPAPSWPTTFGLGIVSAIFDNIPLTALALEQGGYDWGVLAYAVGFGGSMIWFGSSAGVAISSIFPQARSAGPWLRHGWHVVVAYVVGFFVLLGIMGWHPMARHLVE